MGIHKKCVKCGEWKDISEFAKNGYSKYCKKCYAIHRANQKRSEVYHRKKQEKEALRQQLEIEKAKQSAAERMRKQKKMNEVRGLVEKIREIREKNAGKVSTKGLSYNERVLRWAEQALPKQHSVVTPKAAPPKPNDDILQWNEERLIKEFGTAKRCFGYFCTYKGRCRRYTLYKSTKSVDWTRVSQDSLDCVKHKFYAFLPSDDDYDIDVF